MYSSMEVKPQWKYHLNSVPSSHPLPGHHPTSVSRSPAVTNRLEFSNRSMRATHAAHRLWNDLRPEFQNFSVPSPISPITHHHHLPQVLLSGTPQGFPFNLNKLLISSRIPMRLYIHSPPILSISIILIETQIGCSSLNYFALCSSIPSLGLSTGQPSDLTQRA